MPKATTPTTSPRQREAGPSRSRIPEFTPAIASHLITMRLDYLRKQAAEGIGGLSEKPGEAGKIVVFEGPNMAAVDDPNHEGGRLIELQGLGLNVQHLTPKAPRRGKSLPPIITHFPETKSLEEVLIALGATV